jgi:anti-anti-sigma factor
LHNFDLTTDCLKYYFKLNILSLPNATDKPTRIFYMQTNISVQTQGDTSTIFAGDYLNKLSGEQIERECKHRIDEGCRNLVVNFSETELVNSIGVSILLGVIDAASEAGAKVVFSDVKEDTAELFEMLGLTNHVAIETV